MAAADHLEVPRQHGLFLHHGIDLGDGTIAHYLEGREILRSSIEDFSNGQSLKVINHDQASPKAITISRAISRIGEKRYNLLFNNCEHFANWCKTGRHRSSQMEDFLQKGSLGAMAIGQVVPAALLSGLRIFLIEGLADQNNRAKILITVKKLKQLRIEINKTLELTLEKIEDWIQNNPEYNKKDGKSRKTRSLLFKGQVLEDQIMSLEDLETRIYDLLKTANRSSKSS